MAIYSYAFISVAAVSLISLVGIFTLSLGEARLRKNIFIMVSLAVGALLGDAFIHLIPEALEQSRNTVVSSSLIILGILGFFVIEKFFHWHHHGSDEDLDHVHPVGKLVIFSDGVHNLIDGLIIGASYLAGIEVGVATTIAVILHEIPQEIGDFGVLLHAGYTKTKALWLNFLSALLALAGLFIAFLLGSSSEALIVWILPLAAGGFIYIAVADLIPELQKTKEVKNSLIQILVVTLGVLAMIALTFFE